MDITTTKKTNNGLMIQVCMDIVNTVGTVISVDYDHIVDAELLLPLHIIKQPPLGLQQPAGYVHPGIVGLMKHRSQLHLPPMSVLPLPTTTPLPQRAVTLPPTDVSTGFDEGPWSPDASEGPSNPDASEESGPIAAPSPLMLAPALELWKSAHSSQHMFYKLDTVICCSMI
ncbi:hypothetical protein AAF712_011948 [Marasmius tenuissimus]|uniref:Uncharacterized protein n=1 Tax=Marasmius tenuissimus TaxID=585030 RepID=A0ABR2ZLB7_9AGAR